MGRTRVAHNTQIRNAKYTQVLTNTKYKSRGRAALPSPISELAGADSCNLTNCFIFISTIHASPYLVEHNAKQAHVPNIAHINTNVKQLDSNKYNSGMMSSILFSSTQINDRQNGYMVRPTVILLGILFFRQSILVSGHTYQQREMQNVLIASKTLHFS